MEKEEIITSIQITNTILENTIDRLLADNENKEQVALLLHDMFTHNHLASSYLMKFMLGEKFPGKPAEGTIGYVKISDVFYGDHAEKYLKSEYNQQGYLLCIVIKCREISTYSPLELLGPGLEAKGYPYTILTKIENFIPEPGLTVGVTM